MISRHGGPGETGCKLRVRSVFISDTHLGCRYSQAEPLLNFLNEIEPDQLYLVGDIIDGWRLKSHWHWQGEYTRILSRLIRLGQTGTQVRYTPGNHDAFLREFLHDFGCVEIGDEFVHETADGRYFLVLHGDRFDNVEIRAQWLSVVGSHAYDWLMWADHQINRVRRWLSLERSCFSGWLKRRVKRAMAFVSHFEERLARHSREAECDGIICGHVHTPAVTHWPGLTYFNTGDWVEHRTALIEYDNGAMELVHLPGSPQEICRVPHRLPIAAEQDALQPDEIGDALLV
jgi:UDP-2,3-diacylglucosamine pyrophosphatase LpxH